MGGNAKRRSIFVILARIALVIAAAIAALLEPLGKAYPYLKNHVLEWNGSTDPSLLTIAANTCLLIALIGLVSAFIAGVITAIVGYVAVPGIIDESIFDGPFERVFLNIFPCAFLITLAVVWAKHLCLFMLPIQSFGPSRLMFALMGFETYIAAAIWVSSNLFDKDPLLPDPDTIIVAPRMKALINAICFYATIILFLSLFFIGFPIVLAEGKMGLNLGNLPNILLITIHGLMALTVIAFMFSKRFLAYSSTQVAHRKSTLE